jgi:hypothetical protein
MAPPSLNAIVLDRRKTSFRVNWVAPATSTGGSVAGYQVRYAKSLITSANFDDSAVATAVPYAGVPAAVGQADSVVISSLYIENGYYFGVASVDAEGRRSGITSTSAAVAVHFNMTAIDAPRAPMAEIFGIGSDGSADVNGDGLSDLVVGTGNTSRAYLFLGTTSLSTIVSPTPSVTFTGASTGFGSQVRFVGDVDNDGKPDIAIADRVLGNKVFIYRGRATWPATLADTGADYVISTDTTFANSQFGVSMAPLGDFNGDGVPDFAIGAPGFDTRSGRVVIVLGKTGFASLTLPDAANTITITADPALSQSQFGYRVLGLGQFYAGAGNALVVSAPGLSDVSTISNEGHVYAFRGQNPMGNALSALMADQTLVGTAHGQRLGQNLTNLGPIANGSNALGSGNSLDETTIAGAHGTDFVLYGTSATGPFASKVVVYASGAANEVGQAIIGGGFSGKNTSASLIGDAAPDLVVVPFQGSGIEIIDGAKLVGLGAVVDASTLGQVQVPFPTGWNATVSNAGGLIPDFNNDGYADFVIDDNFGSFPGRVVIYW